VTASTTSSTGGVASKAIRGPVIAPEDTPAALTTSATSKYVNSWVNKAHDTAIQGELTQK
jgi:hypothetical protein